MKLNEQFINAVEKIVMQLLRKFNLLQGDHRLGTVDEVLSPTKLKVFVDGGSESQTVSCNPDVQFVSGDNVYVLFINNNPNDKYVPYRRSVAQ